MALSNVFKNFQAARQANEQAELGDLQKANAIQGMLAQLQARQRESAFASDLESLGEGATEEQRAAVAARHIRDPKALFGIQQKSIDRQDANAARREAVQARADAAREAAQARKESEAAKLEMQGQFAKMQHEVRMSQAANDAARQQETARHNKIMEDIQAQLVQLRGDQAAAKNTPKPAGEPGGQSPENAGKIAMGQQAVEAIGTVRGIVFDKDGKLNRSLVAAMNLPIVSGLPGNSQARIARSAIRNAVEAKLRIETGAAATEPEVERTLARFLPTIADTDESAKFKLDELEKFFKTSLSLTKGAPKPGGGPTRLKFDANGNPVQ